MRFSLLILFMVPIVSSASETAGTFVTEDFLSGLSRSVKRRCEKGSLLNHCFSVNVQTCEMRVASRLDGCVRDQRIKLMGQKKIVALIARQVERDVDSCVNSEYFKLSDSSFRSTPECMTLKKSNPLFAAAMKGTRVAAPVAAPAAAFEDPLDDQRSIEDSYKLRLISDLRKVREFKSDLTSRKLCPSYKGKDLSGCFHAGLSNFNISSGTQIVELMVVATYAGILDRDSGYAKGRENMVDNILSILERTDLHKFHLSRFNPAGEVERESLANLRKQDEDLLQVILRRTNETLSPYLGENGGRLKRQPSSAVDFRGRLDFQLNREWLY